MMNNYPMGPGRRPAQRGGYYSSSQQNYGQQPQSQQDTGQYSQPSQQLPNGLLGKLFNPQDPLGSINKIVSIMKILG